MHRKRFDLVSLCNKRIPCDVITWILYRHTRISFIEQRSQLSKCCLGSRLNDHLLRDTFDIPFLVIPTVNQCRDEGVLI